MTTPKPFAFVLMPFDAAFDDIYKLGIKEVASQLGVVAERVDEQIYAEGMLERIYRQIDAADFIIADMTGRNENVFYEVGYAHAKGKLCTLLTKSTKDIPFDLKHHRHLVYGDSIQTLRAKLATEIAWLKSEAEKKKSSYFSVSVKSAEGSLTKVSWADTGSIEIVIDIHNNTDKKSPEIEAIYLHTRKGWKFSQSQEECPSTDSNLEDYEKRNFVKASNNRLSPGGWAQIRVSGERTLWTNFGKKERKESYTIRGRVLLEIVTAEGTFQQKLNLEIELDEIPF
ncbi:hypothetical protein [Mesorhizobium sp. DCY119]|uniref:hypothetical protein n=1 Tax=Mesorhizobium sp. DCY119 TaxID=2108445 RepID=UPI000E75D160|nr:hypothetical protein [Mesorhizobium sp. DCY119]RJG45463.1 hypothetical protein D3Y55_15165 [Mesorhizobium sp. DCY119]